MDGENKPKVITKANIWLCNFFSPRPLSKKIFHTKKSYYKQYQLIAYNNRCYFNNKIRIF
jgi:hypothetical protein